MYKVYKVSIVCSVLGFEGKLFVWSTPNSELITFINIKTDDLVVVMIISTPIDHVDSFSDITRLEHRMQWLMCCCLFFGFSLDFVAFLVFFFLDVSVGGVVGTEKYKTILTASKIRF
jgi:hypothetical protein